MNMESNREVVLVTGGKGFLGQHIIKHLLNDEITKEIRVLDKISSRDNFLDFESSVVKPVIYFLGDLCDKENCRKALRGVDVVIHCAALVSYHFPPDKEALHLNNVTGTKNLIELCVEENISRLIYSSTIEVTLQPYIRGGIVAMVVYIQESRDEIPKDESKLIFGEYAASKLRAENIILNADGTILNNGRVLRTVSLRPPLIYGEGDVGFIWQILKVAKTRGNSLIKIAGIGGKQEMAYVGNVAWGFICAKNGLAKCPENIGGLPIFITDDTTVENLFRFCERLTRNTKNHINLSWSIPMPISYLFAWFTEFAVSYVFPFFVNIDEKKFPISPRSFIAYLGSMILHNRNRASIYINYSPIFNREETLKLASVYYSKIYEE